MARLHGDRTANHAGRIWIRAREHGTRLGAELSYASEAGVRTACGRGRAVRISLAEGHPEPGWESPGPGSQLTRPVSRSLQLTLHTGGRIRGKVPLAGRRGHEGRRGFLPHLHSFNSNRDPKLDAREQFSSGSSHVVLLWASAPLERLQDTLYLARIASAIPFSVPSAALRQQVLGLGACYREKKKNSRRRERRRRFSSRETCERPSCSCP